jgi:hypothetical protein
MSVDLIFNRNLTNEEVLEKTSLKIGQNKYGQYLDDEYGNAVAFYNSYITIRLTNPLKIMDELVGKCGVKFLDDNTSQMWYSDSEKYKNIDLYVITMIRHGYWISFDGNIIIPDRKEEDYFSNREDSYEDDIDGLTALEIELEKGLFNKYDSPENNNEPNQN